MFFFFFSSPPLFFSLSFYVLSLFSSISLLFTLSLAVSLALSASPGDGVVAGRAVGAQVSGVESRSSVHCRARRPVPRPSRAAALLRDVCSSRKNKSPHLQPHMLCFYILTFWRHLGDRHTPNRSAARRVCTSKIEIMDSRTLTLVCGLLCCASRTHRKSKSMMHALYSGMQFVMPRLSNA